MGERVRNIDWIRQPEPELELERPEEYHDLATRAFKESDEAFAAELAGIIPQNFEAAVVDFGCATGNQAIPLAKLRPDLLIVGFDYSSEMLEIAEREANKAGITRMRFVQGDFTNIQNDLGRRSGIYAYSNTALHELRDEEQFYQAIEGIAEAVGETGGCYLRDLALPQNSQQAKEWRAEIVEDSDLSKRELALFENSQHAGFTLDTWKRAIERTSLAGRGELIHHKSPKSRYITFEVKVPGR